MPDVRSRNRLRPGPLPSGPWSVLQRCDDLLFAHWPLEAAEIAPLLPAPLEVETFAGSAWISIVPFRADRLRMRGVPGIPGRLPGLSLRTSVRERGGGQRGAYLFSLDGANPLAVTVARAVYHVPCYWSLMSLRQTAEREFLYKSERLFSSRPAGFAARYRSLGVTPGLAAPRAGTLEHFLTGRDCLFAADRRGRVFRGPIHRIAAPLESAEAEFLCNELPGAHGIRLPATPPILHYARQQAVYLWPLQPLARPELRVSVPAAPARSF